MAGALEPLQCLRDLVTRDKTSSRRLPASPMKAFGRVGDWRRALSAAGAIAIGEEGDSRSVGQRVGTVDIDCSAGLF